VSLCTLLSSQSPDHDSHCTINYLGYPLGRFGGLKHRQLARQVGVIITTGRIRRTFSSSRSIYMVCDMSIGGCNSIQSGLYFVLCSIPELTSPSSTPKPSCSVEAKSIHEVLAACHNSSSSRSKRYQQKQRNQSPTQKQIQDRIHILLDQTHVSKSRPTK
jgi:hypothetical protein